MCILGIKKQEVDDKFLAEFCRRGKTYRKAYLNFCLNTTKNSRNSDLYTINKTGHVRKT